MWETLREAIDEEMEADPAVLVMGEHSSSCTGGGAAHASMVTIHEHPLRRGCGSLQSDVQLLSS